MLSDEYRYKILRLLEEDPQMSQRALARALGISLGKVNFCLQALIEKGTIKANTFLNSRNKRAYIYVLTPHGIRERARITVRFLRTKMSEYEAIRQEIAELTEHARQLGVDDSRNAPRAK